MARKKIALIGSGMIGGTLAHLAGLKELVGHNQPDIPRTQHHHPAAWQNPVDIDHRLDGSRPHHTGQGAAGERCRIFRSACRQNDRSGLGRKAASAAQHRQPSGTTTWSATSPASTISASLLPSRVLESPSC